MPQEDVEEKTKSPRPKKELRCVPERWPQSAANQRVKSSASSARGLPKPATRATDGQPTPATHRERARAAETAGEAHDAKQTMSTTGPPKKLTLILYMLWAAHVLSWLRFENTRARAGVVVVTCRTVCTRTHGLWAL